MCDHDEEIQNDQASESPEIIVEKDKEPDNKVDIVCDLEKEFSCGPGRGCVPYERVCDLSNDCGDWSGKMGSDWLILNIDL